jgi:hypothetical protein
MNSYGLQRSYKTAEGCEVLQIRTISTRANVLTPVEHIILWVPEKDEKELDKR